MTARSRLMAISGSSGTFERARNRLRARLQRKKNEPVTVYIPNVIDETQQRDLLIEHRQSPRSPSPISCRSYHMRPVSPFVRCAHSPESGIYKFNDFQPTSAEVAQATALEGTQSEDDIIQSQVKPYKGGILENSLEIFQNDACTDDPSFIDDQPTSTELAHKVSDDSELKSQVKPYISDTPEKSLEIVQNESCVDDLPAVTELAHTAPDSDDSQLKSQVKPYMISGILANSLKIVENGDSGDTELKCQAKSYIGDILANSLQTVQNDSCVDDQPTATELAHQVPESDDSQLIEKKVLDREAVMLTAPEYAADIYKYLRGTEIKNRAKPDYMKRQQDITPSMRSILVDWLVEVSEEFKFHRETLFLAVNYIDRFLSKISILRGKLQLVGAASMFLAAKYEEVDAPDATEIAYFTDDTYTEQQVLRMEQTILKVLTFDVGVPTTHWFCEAFVKWSDGDEKLNALTMFLAESTLIEMDTYLNYTPSLTAASCLCMARYSLGLETWPASLVKKTSYEIGHMVDCLNDLHKTYLSAESRPQQQETEVLYQRNPCKQLLEVT